jgi:hypothetical protein
MAESRLKYHQTTFDLLGWQPTISLEAEQLLEHRQQDCGCRFPASVVEWFSVNGIISVFGDYGAPDNPVALEDLGRPEHNPFTKSLLDFTAAGYLVFLYENQANCKWAVRLDGSDDPPVYFDEQAFPAIDSATEVKWHSCLVPFSTWAYSRIWDFGTALGFHPTSGYKLFLDGSGNEPAPPPLLDYLMERLVQKARSFDWPGGTIYRFAYPGAALRIHAFDSQSDWSIGATSEEALEKLLERIVIGERLPVKLYANDARTAAVLKGFK